MCYTLASSGHKSPKRFKCFQSSWPTSHKSLLFPTLIPPPSFPALNKQNNEILYIMAFALAFLSAIIGTLSVIKLLDIHTVHSRLWKCQRRTKTNRQTRFEKLSRYYVPIRNAGTKRPISQHFMTFEFDPTHPSFVVEIPQGNYRSSVSCMHRTLEMCADCEVLQDP